MIRLLTFSFLFFFFHQQQIAQTVGMLSITDEATEGYTFFSPFSGTDAWMVDNCGNLINHWDRDFRPGLAAYFLENGTVLRTYKPNPVGPFISASNSGGLEIVDWNNNTLWSYELNDAENISHHDAILMPNGNILMLTWQLVYEDELIALGRNPNEIDEEGYVWSERIVEIEPIGSDEINIVWEWAIKDHYIQDFDPNQANFGVVAEHPELFDINLPELDSDDSHPRFDWNHFNAIDYHEDLDQILISVRNSDELWIIDHSTTTQEAAGHSGGNSGKGGDILYRWGNAAAYDRAPVSEQKFFGQHGTHWIPEGLLDAGKIMIYNNGRGRPGQDYSTIEILEPPIDAAGNYLFPTMDEPFAPENSDIIYGDLAGENFFSAYLSNAQRLANGNTLINAGSPGRIFEINDDRTIVWEYEIPLFADSPAIQGGNINNNSNFRAYKFTPDFAGFTGIDIEPGNTIESGENPLACPLYVSTNEETIDQIELFFNSITGELRIENDDFLAANLRVVNVQGQVVFSDSNVQNATVLAIESGIYVVEIFDEYKNQVVQKILKF